MPILRTVPQLLAGFALAVAAAAAYTGLTDPFAPRIVDGLLTAAVFAIGGAVGTAVARRVVPTGLSRRHPSTRRSREPIAG